MWGEVKNGRIKMTIHYNKISEKVNRKKLRSRSTEAENILWEHLRGKKLAGLKFKRQYSVDHFVVDFYCTELKLAIELDGMIHSDKEIKNHDENRDGYLSEFGIQILRIKNEIVLGNVDKALELIRNKIKEIKTLK